MSRLQSILTLCMLACALGAAWAQDTTAPPPTGTEPQQNPPQEPAQQQEPVPAYGQENAPLPISENPPLSGLDLPNLEPHAAPLSYIQPGATVSESADSNIANTTGTGSVHSISRGLGSVVLQRLWSNYDLALDYMGGVGYYNQNGLGFKALQQADVDQKITWKRGQLSLRDSFSYLPEGTFGGAYGSIGSEGIASLGNSAFSSFWGGSSFGAVGEVPRLTNVALADVQQDLSPKSAITAAGGYAFTHFSGTDIITHLPYLNSSQISAQSGYNRLLSAKTQIALMYGYQGFNFSTLGTAFHSHIIQAMYGHRISGRMDFLVGAGPQLTHIGVCPVPDVQPCPGPETPDFRIGVAGRARLRYKFPRTSMDLSYERFQTTGSGIFAGAQTDVGRLTADRPLTRVWSAFGDIGYSRNHRLQSTSSAVNANKYDYGFVGVGLHRAFGRNFRGFVSYQFNELSLDRSFCGTSSSCSRIANRQVGTIGLDWTPRPMRID
jgi:hypothetical protein